MTYKSVGPCCGYVSYYDCTDDIALELDDILTTKIYEVYNEQMTTITQQSESTAAPISTTPAPTSTSTNTNLFSESCNATEYSDWSTCSKICGSGGIQFRYRSNDIDTVEVQPCPTEVTSALPACDELCVPEFGPEFSVTVVASDLASPRDLAFHPTPGVRRQIISTRCRGRALGCKWQQSFHFDYCVFRNTLSNHFLES